MNSFDRHAAAPPSIATRAELEQRLRERADPAPERRLEPNGPDGAKLRHDAALSNEQRIAHLRERLATARTMSLTDQAFARLPGHARAEFQRSR